jgi:hypothetical protein
VRKWRTLYEGPEWDSCRKRVDPSITRFDEAFRWTAENIATAPVVNSTAFLSEDHRVIIMSFPGVAEVWIYFRIEPDDESCTLLWVESRGGQIPFRVG